MPDTQINIQSEETAIEFIQEQVAIDFVQEEVQIEFIQETTQIDFVSENIVLNLTGVPGPAGPAGPAGADGADGTDGADGVGVPAGGAAGQVLAKVDGTDYNAEWVDQTGGPGGASYTEITYNDMVTAIDGSTLTPGGWYLITDATGTDLGFLTYAVNENTISVQGTGGYLNADFQAVGDYTGVEAETGVATMTPIGIWRIAFEELVIPYTNLQPQYATVAYSTSSGVLDDAETYTTDLGGTGTVVHDDGAGTVTLTPDAGQTLAAGEVITGDTSTNTVTVDSYTPAGVFAVGDTITGGNTGATAVITSDNGTDSMTVYITSPGVAFDGSEALDNGSGVTADMNGAAGVPTIVLGDIVIWNLLHYQLTDISLLDGNNPATNAAAYTLLSKTVASVGYITAWDVSEFDFANAWLQYRADSRGNKVSYSLADDENSGEFGLSAISFFQFGNDSVLSNIIIASYVDDQNFIGRIFSNNLSAGSNISGNTCNSSLASISANNIRQSSIQSNTLLSDGARISTIKMDNSSVDNCIIGQNSGIQSIDMVLANRITNISLANSCSVEKLLFYPSAQMLNITIGDSGQITNNILENGATLTGITAGANCSISRNKIGQGATLGGGTTMGDGAQMNDQVLAANASINQVEMAGNNEFLGNIVGIQAQISQITMGASANFNRNNFATDSGASSLLMEDNTGFTGNDFDISSSISSCTIRGSRSVSVNKFKAQASFSQNDIIEPFTFNEIGANASISNKNISAAISNSRFSGIIDTAESIVGAISNKAADAGFYNIPGTIDISGLTALDCTAAFAQYRGIYNLTSSNPTESIDTITNPPTAFPFTIRPAAGLVLTITGTAYSGIAAGQIALKATDYTIDGDKGEYIILEIDPLGTGALIEKQVVNGLI